MDLFGKKKDKETEAGNTTPVGTETIPTGEVKPGIDNDLTKERLEKSPVGGSSGPTGIINQVNKDSVVDPNLPEHSLSRFEHLNTEIDKADVENIGKSALNRDIAAAEMERIREGFIRRPAPLTQDEADRLKVGAGPEKSKEIQARVLDYHPETRYDTFNDIQSAVNKIVTDNSLGLNETVAQLKTLRQFIQGLEVQLTRG